MRYSLIMMVIMLGILISIGARAQDRLYNFCTGNGGLYQETQKIPAEFMIDDRSREIIITFQSGDKAYYHITNEDLFSHVQGNLKIKAYLHAGQTPFDRKISRFLTVLMPVSRVLGNQKATLIFQDPRQVYPFALYQNMNCTYL